jgi:hypothetical protein
MVVIFAASYLAQAAEVQFTIRSTRDGNWSDPATWTDNRLPKAGDSVQITPGHRVVHDVSSNEALRVVHCGGTLVSMTRPWKSAHWNSLCRPTLPLPFNSHSLTEPTTKPFPPSSPAAAAGMRMAHP